LAYSPDDLGPRLVARSGRNLETVRIAPQLLRVDEIDPVLLEIDCRLRRIELEVHQV